MRVTSALNAAWAFLQKPLCMNCSNLGTQLLSITTQRRAAGARDREGRTFLGGVSERILYIDVFSQELKCSKTCRTKIICETDTDVHLLGQQDWGARTKESWILSVGGGFILLIGNTSVD